MEESKGNIPSTISHDEPSIHPFVSLKGHEEWLREDEKQLTKEYIIDLFNRLETDCHTEGSGWNEEKLTGSDNIKGW